MGNNKTASADTNSETYCKHSQSVTLQLGLLDPHIATAAENALFIAFANPVPRDFWSKHSGLIALRFRFGEIESKFGRCLTNSMYSVQWEVKTLYERSTSEWASERVERKDIFL